MTHTTQHTPGPWTVSSIRSNRELEPSQRKGYAGSMAYIYTDRPYPQGKCVAMVREELFGEVEANATLIAAAPELLNAAEAYLETVRMCINHGFSGAHFDHMALADGTLRAAIAKAKGGL